MENPNFIFDKESLNVFYKQVKDKSHIIQNNFYKYGREKFKILLNNDGTYIGDRLSFDIYNRKPYSNDIQVEDLRKFNVYTKKELAVIKEAQQYVEENFKDNIGNTTNISHIHFTRKSAKRNLNKFITDRLIHFGDYQDAFSIKEDFLYHSNISHSLNIGLLNPTDVITEVEKYYLNNKVSVSIM